MPRPSSILTFLLLPALMACGEDDAEKDASYSRRLLLPLVEKGGKEKGLFHAVKGEAGALWNPRFWGASLGFDQFTGIGWNTERAGVLVTPQHLVAARHYPLKPNSTIHFYDKDGRCVVRQIPPTVQGKPTVRYLENDIMIAKLDRPVPDSIRIYALPDPDGYEQRQAWGRLPEGERPLLIATDWRNPVPKNADGTQPTPAWKSTRSAHPVRLAPTRVRALEWTSGPRHGEPKVHPDYHEIINVGDSGHPLFWVSKSGLVLASTFCSTISGPDYGNPDIQAELQKHINQMGGAEKYRLRTVSVP